MISIVFIRGTSITTMILPEPEPNGTYGTTARTYSATFECIALKPDVITNGRNEKGLRALTSPGGRSPGSPNMSSLPICKTATKSKSESHISKADMVAVTIKSTISSFKPLKLVMKKTTGIRVLKNYLQSRLGGAHQITLIHDNKELKNEGGSLASAGVSSGSVLWLLVKPVAGNNDREEIASLIRMSQSLANLRNLIRTLPPIGSVEPSFSGSAECTEVTPYEHKEAEHEQMREKMKLLIQRREKARRNNAKDLFENVQQKIEDMLDKESPTDPLQSSLRLSSPCRPSFPLPSPFSTRKGTADIVKQRELATYFDPPETVKQRKFQEEELFDVPSNESELFKAYRLRQFILTSHLYDSISIHFFVLHALVRPIMASNSLQVVEIREEIRNKRCGLCRMKLHIADREIQCICGYVFCSKHRNPQTHRCSVDLKSVDRVHMRTTLPKLVRDIPKSKI
uniref:AN1-type domain-containing protein n=1 Tax=Setaria digitata TaxID=48799 RepID=A0A915PKP1_9BILA